MENIPGAYIPAPKIGCINLILWKKKREPGTNTNISS